MTTNRSNRATVVLFAAISWIPQFLSAPGKVAADTKQFLYLDPQWLLGRAASLWDPAAGLGTVTHQNIGYLWPMGPWYAAAQIVGMPMWIAQRLWFGALLFVAAMGVRWLARLLDITGVEVTAAALIYALSPYQLAYLGRTSALLLPWAGLPWLIGLAVVAGRRGSWRAPALFALAIGTIGGTNASSLLFVGLGPVLWFPFAVWIARELPWRRALAAMVRIGVCTIPVQLWWIAGLRTQAAYGLPILQLTETVQTVAETSTASEILRGLGYWYFYGRDGVGSWTDSVRWYTTNAAMIVVSFLLPAIGMLGGVLTRWRYRTYFVLLILVGLVLGVGTHPYDSPPLFGAAIKAASNAGTAAFAMRNSPRAVPLLSLGLAMLTAVALAALGRWLLEHRPHIAARGVLAGAGAVSLLAVVNLPPLWTGKMVQPQLQRPEDIPQYWKQATAALDAQGTSTRVLELPGQDFGSYRWGNTQDVITRGLMTRPWVGRELIPFGSPASADLVRALDHRLQEGTFEPAAVAPVARLMGVGTVLLRTDAQYERFRTPRPKQLLDAFTPTPAGLAAPVAYGPAAPNEAVASQPLVDETALGTPATTPWPAPVLTYQVSDPQPIVRASSAAAPIEVAGDGEGIVDAAEAGLIDGTTPIVYSAELADGPQGAVQHVIITDSNRKRAQRWGTLRENFGYTETATETALVDDPKDARLGTFSDETTADQSVTVYGGNVTAVRASAYGNPVSYTAEDRPANALDGDTRTAWKADAFHEAVGERWRVDLTKPVTVDHLDVVQPLGGVVNRWITAVTVRFSDGSQQQYTLNDDSRTETGQRLSFGSRSTSWIEIQIDGTSLHKRGSYAGVSPVGFAEVRVDGVGPLDERVRLPQARDPLNDSETLDVVLSRLRANPAEPFRADPESALAREFTVPNRSYVLSGEVRLSARTADKMIDQLTARPGPPAASSDRLAGLRTATASAAVDGDLATFWSPGFLDQTGRWLEVSAPTPVAVSQLKLSVLADGRHSVPTKLRLTADHGTPIDVDVPAVVDGTDPNQVATVNVPTPAFTATTLRVEIASVRTNRTIDFYSGQLIDMPVGIAELGLAGFETGSRPAAFDSGCRSDLLRLNGAALRVRITGSTGDALAGRPLALATCDAGTVRLGGTPTELRAAAGLDSGLDIDRIVLHATGTVAPIESTNPTVVATPRGLDAFDVTVTNPTGKPFWLVLGQSRSAGWQATTSGTDLGGSQLLDGYANAWLITNRATSLHVHLEWTPEHAVRIGLLIAAIAALVCLGLVIRDPGSARATAVSPARPPSLRPLWWSGGVRPKGPVVAITILVSAAIAFIVAGPAVGFAIGLTTAAAVTVGDRFRLALSVPPWAFFGPIALATAVAQWHFHPKPGVEWPSLYNPSHQLMLFATLAAGADGVVCWVRRRAAADVASTP